MSVNKQLMISRGVVVGMVALASVTASEAQGRLADTTSLDCRFTTIATGTWTEGDAEASLDVATLTMQFEEIDTDSATAEVVGPYGASSIIVRQTGDYLHLVQMFMVGPLYTTTVIDRETTDGKLMAVHTRHEYTDTSLPGFTSRPEQYYGECATGS
ncbi:MAG: hypothetical protein CL477_13290 [Acidobacteria bacterium]|jgi:hypothetical protein|nr:hypothetical protein [Acidobacteriota bacterium]MDP7338285.1 hypothetical protein [Vicinamibacterales bacterium]MDP7478366.1 hypothetical protein [Vicinamibacterales bacterium]HJN42601.1 hypothetical protein [Vicinamibacterales bacterium]|tara:strand:+ start:11630 stop:12100 length:471 start_codon:yes stop_codon:yes gene_type:complete